MAEKRSVSTYYSVWWPIPPDQAAGTWQAHFINSLPPFSPVGQFGNSIHYHFSSAKIPGWAIVLAIVLFPFGLLFLLARRHYNQSVTISFAQAERGTWVTASGIVPPMVQDVLDWTAQQMQPPAQLPSG